MAPPHKHQFPVCSALELALAFALAPGSMKHNRHLGRQGKVVAKGRLVLKRLEGQGFTIVPKPKPPNEVERALARLQKNGEIDASGAVTPRGREAAAEVERATKGV